MNALLDKLLQSTKDLTAQLPSQGLPELHRNLTQLDAASRKQFKSVSADPFIEQKAAALLAESGLDPSEHGQSLQRIDVTAMFEPLVNLAEEDVDRFLAHQYQMLIGTAVEESSRLCNFAFRRQCVSKMESDWERTKRDILEQMGQRLDQRQISAAPHMRNAMVLSTQSEASSSGGPRWLQKSAEPQLHYQHVITQLNKHRLHDREFPLVDAFIDAEQQLSNNEDFMEQWQILHEMVNHQDDDLQALENKNQTRSTATLLEGALRYSQEEYYAYMKDVCASKPHVARIGGNPTAINHCKGFLNVVLRSNKDEWPTSEDAGIDMVDGYPLWPLVFYCVRSGKVQEALEVCDAAMLDGKTSIGTFRDAFMSRLEYKRQGRAGLDETAWQRLNKEFDQDVVQSGQAYKIALYHIIGRFAVNEKYVDLYKSVFKSTEDYIWQKLHLVWDDRRASPPDWLGNSAISSLKQFQKSVTDHGPAYFNPTGEDPLRYYKILLMSLQFEAAVFYLTATNVPRLFSFGLHFAFALRYYDLLASRPSPDSQARVDFQFLMHKIWHFIDSFYRTHPDIAFQYLYLLYDSDTNQTQKEEFEKHVVRLLWQSKEYPRLIGTKKSGHIHRGIIYSYLPDEAGRIIRFAGQKAKQLGAYEDAITIYTLAGADEEVGEIVIDRLSEVVHAPPTHPQTRWLLDQARMLLRSMTRQEGKDYGQWSSREEVVKSLTVLHELGNFFELCHQGMYVEAEKAAMDLEVISFMPTDLSGRHEENFQRLDDRIKRVMRYVVKYLMNMYMQKRQHITQQFGNVSQRYVGRVQRDARDGNLNENMLHELRDRVDALINFVTKHQEYMGNLHHELLRMSASF